MTGGGGKGRGLARFPRKPWGFHANFCKISNYRALGTRAGTDALALLLRFLTELDAERVILQLDGLGAFDNIRRDAMRLARRLLRRGPGASLATTNACWVQILLYRRAGFCFLERAYQEVASDARRIAGFADCAGSVDCAPAPLGYSLVFRPAAGGSRWSRVFMGRWP